MLEDGERERVVAWSEQLRTVHDRLREALGLVQGVAAGPSSPGAARDELDRHVEGIAAIMESHFRFEGRALHEVLRTLDLAADTEDVLGPL